MSALRPRCCLSLSAGLDTTTLFLRHSDSRQRFEIAGGSRRRGRRELVGDATGVIRLPTRQPRRSRCPSIAPSLLLATPSPLVGFPGRVIFPAAMTTIPLRPKTRNDDEGLAVFISIGDAAALPPPFPPPRWHSTSDARRHQVGRASRAGGDVSCSVRPRHSAALPSFPPRVLGANDAIYGARLRVLFDIRAVFSP